MNFCHVTKMCVISFRHYIFVCAVFQKKTLKDKYDKLVKRTGSEGGLSLLEKEIVRVMGKDKDTTGDTVGSSAEGIKVIGN